ncbi:MAG: response regulator [Burkholderiales bacterium]
MIEILLVDDDALVRGLLAEWLVAAGYGVQHADNGSTALEMLLTRDFGLLITDMDMPISGGLDIIKAVRRMRPGLRVIAVSGGKRDGGQNWSVSALDHGATKTLPKPLERSDLLAAVEQLAPLDKSHTKRA